MLSVHLAAKKQAMDVITQRALAVCVQALRRVSYRLSVDSIQTLILQAPAL
jgi:hypothetical protein